MSTDEHVLDAWHTLSDCVCVYITVSVYDIGMTSFVLVAPASQDYSFGFLAFQDLDLALPGCNAGTGANHQCSLAPQMPRDAQPPGPCRHEKHVCCVCQHVPKSLYFWEMQKLNIH